MKTAAIAPAIVVLAAFVIYCLVDMFRRPATRVLPNWLWAIICLICNPLGGILYLIFGRAEA
jgi:hypothetical protein